MAMNKQEEAREHRKSVKFLLNIHAADTLKSIAYRSNAEVLSTNFSYDDRGSEE